MARAKLRKLKPIDDISSQLLIETSKLNSYPLAVLC